MCSEIDPEFVRNYNDELSKSWTMLNKHGVHQEMIFNKVRDHPMIIRRWPLLEAYHDLPSEVVVEVHTTKILRNYGYEGLILCGDSDMPKMMKLFNVDDPYNTELGPGWDDFCKYNKFDVVE
ncbi:hypothetical protein RYX36_030798 [Vicia faba]